MRDRATLWRPCSVGGWSSLGFAAKWFRAQTNVRSVFVDQLFRRDLFALESPLRTDTTFFGRGDVVSELLDRFRGGQNSGLFGLRRIGKTSVLYALARRGRSGEIAGAIYLDASSPGIYQLRWWELLQRVCVELAAPLDLQRGERSHVRALTITYDAKNAAGHFKNDVQTLAEKLPGRRVILLLDEIEHVTFDISPDTGRRISFRCGRPFDPVHQDTQGQFGFVGAFQKRLAEEKDTVLGWMRHVNRCRSDAHAKKLSDDDLAYLRVCFRRLEEILDFM